MTNLDDDEPGHVVDKKKVATLSSALLARIAKDLVPYAAIAAKLAAMSCRRELPFSYVDLLAGRGND